MRILVWPVSWVTLHFDCGPASVFYIALAIAFASLMLRFAILVKESGIDAVDFVKDYFGIEMEKQEIVCSFSSQNNQCIGKRCPFSKANH